MEALIPLAIIFLVFLSVLWFFFPWLILRKMKQLIRVQEKTFQTHRDLLEEAKRSNTLSRQLLRAYGHEPEA
jgi:hypothetical protein